MLCATITIIHRFISKLKKLLLLEYCNKYDVELIEDDFKLSNVELRVVKILIASSVVLIMLRKVLEMCAIVDLTQTVDFVTYDDCN